MAKDTKAQAQTDFRTLSVEDLTAKVAELRKDLVQQQRSNAAGETASVSVIGKTRRAIARALTILGEKQREAAQKEEN